MYVPAAAGSEDENENEGENEDWLGMYDYHETISSL